MNFLRRPVGKKRKKKNVTKRKIERKWKKKK